MFLYILSSEILVLFPYCSGSGVNWSEVQCYTETAGLVRTEKTIEMLSQSEIHGNGALICRMKLGGTVEHYITSRPAHI